MRPFRRVQRGVPTGGQFAVAEREAALVALDEGTAGHRLAAQIVVDAVTALDEPRIARQARTRAALRLLLGHEAPRVSTARVATTMYGALHRVSESFRLAGKSMWLGERFDVAQTFPADPHLFLGQVLDLDSRAYKGLRDSPSDPRHGQPCVVVTSVDGDDGRTRHIVTIPGTGSILGPTGFNSDLAVLATAHGSPGLDRAMPDLTRRVIEAMEKANVGPDEEVMLVGHSLGGMVAADAASRPDLRARFNITSVVAAGSPLGGFKIPAHVSVLSLSHDEDPIPFLRTGADDPAWLHHKVPAPDSSILVGAHRMGAYRKTAHRFEASRDPRLLAWKDKHAGFMAGTMRVAGFPLMDGRKVQPVLAGTFEMPGLAPAFA